MCSLQHICGVRKVQPRRAARVPHYMQVLTSVAVFGTVLLGCAMEGAMLLLLFSSAHLIEEKLTAHAQARRRICMASPAPCRAACSQTQAVQI